jgi:hypothetical protein
MFDLVPSVWSTFSHIAAQAMEKRGVNAIMQGRVATLDVPSVE